MWRLPLVLAIACTGGQPSELGLPPLPDDSTATVNDGITVADIGIESGFQGGSWFGHFLRGRAGLIGDMDGDGLQDIFVGNPRDESFVLYNRSAAPGAIRFELGPVLNEGHLSWGGALGDMDNDDDLDLYVSGGGNEYPTLSQMWHNQLVERGEPGWTDVTDATHVAGPLDDEGVPRELPSAHANTADFDNDGFLDIFVSVDITPITRVEVLSEKPGFGQNVLWMSTPDGYVDRAKAAGIDSTEATQNSVSLDYDLDGDIDIYENTNKCAKHIWKNQLVETGEATFVDVTSELSLAGGDLSYPWNGFTSAVADFNLDGWEDILVYVRAFEPEESPYDGHVLLINAQGKGFVDVAPLTGLNEPYINWEQDTFRNHSGGGVMGANLGDVNADGIPDVFFSQGGPAAGTASIFQLSTGLEEVEVEGLGKVLIPKYEHRSDLIDYPAAEDPAFVGEYPPYPYRGHAVNFTDFDRNGTVEIALINGGPADMPDIVREPNRLYEFTLPTAPRWFAVQLIGNGTTVNRSAIGAKVSATVRRSSDGVEWTLTRWLHGGNGFSANNGFDLYFGMADADQVVSLDVTWPDGSVSPVVPPPVIGDVLQVSQDGQVRDRDEPWHH
ncbi:MAG: CRTAC1 family protein [Myxococcota bacterium]